MLERACRSDDLPAFGGPTSAICAAPSRRTAIESRWVTRLRTLVWSSCASTHLRMSAYGPFLYPGSSPRIVRSSRIRSEPSLPTSRRLINCICVRCGIGIASRSPQSCGKVREAVTRVRFAPCPAASTDAVVGSGGLAVLRAADGSPAMHVAEPTGCCSAHARRRRVLAQEVGPDDLLCDGRLPDVALPDTAVRSERSTAAVHVLRSIDRRLDRPLQVGHFRICRQAAEDAVVLGVLPHDRAARLGALQHLRACRKPRGDFVVAD